MSIRVTMISVVKMGLMQMTLSIVILATVAKVTKMKNKNYKINKIMMMKKGMKRKSCLNVNVKKTARKFISQTKKRQN